MRDAGECLGFTYSMANPTLSPCDNPGKKIDLNQEIHNYQEFQADREKDQATIKSSRLTREHFKQDMILLLTVPLLPKGQFRQIPIASPKATKKNQRNSRLH
ncbi:hypothetical protein [Legionella rowbothamii]|uniref:hypothetical protein n=1 Tax=Legionella rowbothamii TaxID=96229 RepID=UPI00105517B9|nr:hypothetical protein [Legionella rowbothamii]